MRNLKILIKRRSDGAWRQLNSAERVAGTLCPHGSNYFHCPDRSEVRNESDGVSHLPVAGFNYHGWFGGRQPINGDDIAAVVVALEGRLIKDSPNGTDDRGRAKYLIQVGADYYPSADRADTLSPSVGISRAKLVTNDWQPFLMTTFSDVGTQEPGGGISAQQLRDNPPPSW